MGPEVVTTWVDVQRGPVNESVVVRRLWGRLSPHGPPVREHEGSFLSGTFGRSDESLPHSCRRLGRHDDVPPSLPKAPTGRSLVLQDGLRTVCLDRVLSHEVRR